MADSPNRIDTWVQWAGVVLVILGALWNVAGRLSRIEQQLRDDAQFHESESQRVEQLERRFDDYLNSAPYKHVVP